MVRYPIVVRVMSGARKVAFPDFPGCYFIFKLTRGPVDTEDAFRAAIRAEALNWLIGTPEQPGWIPRRLRSGFSIARPETYSFRLLDSETGLEADPLPEHIERGLEIHWLRLELGVKSREEMAAKTGIELARYVALEEGLIKPNHHDKAALKHIRQRSQTQLMRYEASSEEEYDVFAS